MKKLLLFALLPFALGGCYAGLPTIQDNPGLLFADYKSGVDAEGQMGPKKGEACSESILGWVGIGDSSIQTAASNGGITVVTGVDRTSKNILGVYAKYCTVVYGK